jgi:hypothetical protein
LGAALIAATTSQVVIHQTKSRPLTWVIVVLIILAAFVCLGCLVCGGLSTSVDQAISNIEDRSSVESTSTLPVDGVISEPESETPKTIDENSNPVIREEAPDYRTIADNCAEMTDIKWNRYSETLVGKKITDWTGTITEVNETIFGGYELWIDMDDPADILSTQDVYFPCTEETALEWDKGDGIKFSGVIKSVNDLLGTVSIHLE